MIKRGTCFSKREDRKKAEKFLDWQATGKRKERNGKEETKKTKKNKTKKKFTALKKKVCEKFPDGFITIRNW